MSTSLLLSASDPEPVLRHNARGGSRVVLTCDHAGFEVPETIDLGVAEDELRRHIGWDIGALAVAEALADLLDAPLVAQRYSRLVIDCNRRPGVLTSIPETSDGTVVPGNLDLEHEQRRQREAELLEPYHAAIEGLLDERGDDAVLVPVHSFTPRLADSERPWHVSLMNGEDRRLHDALLRGLRQRSELHVGDNEPYRVEPVDFTMPVHGSERGIACSMIEVRQDLIEQDDGQERWALLLAEEIRRAVDAAL